MSGAAAAASEPASWPGTPGYQFTAHHTNGIVFIGEVQAPAGPQRLGANRSVHDTILKNAEACTTVFLNVSGPNLSDKDCSYVKFPRRMDPSHEYSYPKLIDAYKPSDTTLSQHQVAVTSASTTTPSKSKAGTPPLPPSFSGMGGKHTPVAVTAAGTTAATSSSNSSG